MSDHPIVENEQILKQLKAVRKLLLPDSPAAPAEVEAAKTQFSSAVLDLFSVFAGLLELADDDMGLDANDLTNGLLHRLLYSHTVLSRHASKQ